MKINGNSVIAYTQKIYKVGFGPDLWRIISEDSLDRYTYSPGAIEEHGERTIYFLDENEETVLC